MLDEEKNKALVRRFLEERIKGNLKADNEMLAPDFVDFVERSMLPDQELSREDYKRSMVDVATAFSIGSFTIDDQIAEGDKVMTRWTARCVHNRGRFMGVAPTGMEGTYTGVEVHRIARGKIAEEWSESDFSNVMRQRLEQEIRERERIEQELLVARRIQQASLPKEVPTLEGWKINPYFRPAKEVGGDFYEFFELDDGRVGFAVGDATGKGVPAALVMTATCAFLGGVATATGAPPGEVLAQVNEAVFTRIPPNMFVTCFYAILEPGSGHLQYANAGHNLPCCHHEGSATDLEARGMPLGLMPGMSYEGKTPS